MTFRRRGRPAFIGIDPKALWSGSSKAPFSSDPGEGRSKKLKKPETSLDIYHVLAYTPFVLG